MAPIPAVSLWPAIPSVARINRTSTDPSRSPDERPVGSEQPSALANDGRSAEQVVPRRVERDFLAGLDRLEVLDDHVLNVLATARRRSSHASPRIRDQEESRSLGRVIGNVTREKAPAAWHAKVRRGRRRARRREHERRAVQ